MTATAEAADTPSTPDLEVRYWALCLLAALEGAGLCPADKDQFHGHFFLANALAPTYGEQGVVGMVMKLARGPYYPELDWHLTRLSIQGFVTTSKFRVKVDKQGAWTHAALSLSDSGAVLVTGMRRLSMWEHRFQFFTDMAMGLARLRDDKRMSAAVRTDDTYDRPGLSNRAVTRFVDPESNRSVQTMARLRAAVPAGLQYSKQDLLRTYAKLLDLKAA